MGWQEDAVHCLYVVSSPTTELVPHRGGFSAVTQLQVRAWHGSQGLGWAGSAGAFALSCMAVPRWLCRAVHPTTLLCNSAMVWERSRSTNPTFAPEGSSVLCQPS